MQRKSIRLDKALIASLNQTARHFGVTFSKLVRDTLKKEFGVLRIPKRRSSGS